MIADGYPLTLQLVKSYGAGGFCTLEVTGSQSWKELRFPQIQTSGQLRQLEVLFVNDYLSSDWIDMPL